VKAPLDAYRALPLWLRWVLILAFYAVVIALIVVAVSGGGSGKTGLSSEAKAENEANREGRLAIAQDEAPHTAPLSAPADALAELERAVTANVRARIAHGELTGPFQSVRCQSSGAAQGGRSPFSCTARSAGIAYPFVAVADPRARVLTYCKVDPPPVANEPLEVPVSASCRA
jgi:hypothetical protein